MLKVLTSDEMKEYDRYTMEEIGIPSASLMERAAYACADEAEKLLQKYGKGNRNAPEKSAGILVVCGSGNNGGDGYACGRILALRGFRVTFLAAGNPEHMSVEARRQEGICRKLGMSILKDAEPNEYDLIIDALFGIGLTRPVEGSYAVLIGKINDAGVPVLAVDIPSGINADSAEVMGCAVKAEATVTMQYLKPGLLLAPGCRFAGKEVRADIDVVAPDTLRNTDGPGICTLSKEDLGMLPARDPDGNKGSFGKLLVIAGNEEMAGAAFLSAAAALSAGAGMVRILTHKANRDVLLTLLPEALLTIYTDEEDLLRKLPAALSWSDAVVCGPGLGNSERTAACLRYLLKAAELPLILDADALNALSGSAELRSLLREYRKDVIMTPHAGEMARLCGQSITDVKRDPVRTASSFAGEYGVTMVLKDSRTVTAGACGRSFINTSGNSGMATAGSGDVLSGILGALCAGAHAEGNHFVPVEWNDPVFLAAYGVLLHGCAGDEAQQSVGQFGMKARDLIEGLRGILKKI
ncbi:MAG: NAD(P)H-hydrate dehydratase [Lachnospiraceae bacterium]|nr:NAD(P)H-hydrate dehydratase [Lachnospiraceae bacterium]